MAANPDLQNQANDNLRTLAAVTRELNLSGSITGDLAAALFTVMLSNIEVLRQDPITPVEPDPVTPPTEE